MAHASGTSTPRHASLNGLGESYDPKKPSFRGIDLTKPDSRLRVPNVEIDDGTPETNLVAFVDCSILDSTGSQPYRGDVLVRGKTIASVGRKLKPDELVGARVIRGDGRTLMSGMVDVGTHQLELVLCDMRSNLRSSRHTLTSPGPIQLPWTVLPPW